MVCHRAAFCPGGSSHFSHERPTKTRFSSLSSFDGKRRNWTFNPPSVSLALSPAWLCGSVDLRERWRIRSKQEQRRPLGVERSLISTELGLWEAEEIRAAEQKWAGNTKNAGGKAVRSLADFFCCLLLEACSKPRRMRGHGQKWRLWWIHRVDSGEEVRLKWEQKALVAWIEAASWWRRGESKKRGCQGFLE